MHRSYLPIALTCVLSVAGISFLFAQDSPDRANNAATGWEYHAVLLTDVVASDQEPAEQVAAVDERFNELGQKGWELSEQLNRVVVFKRPVK